MHYCCKRGNYDNLAFSPCNAQHGSKVRAPAISTPLSSGGNGGTSDAAVSSDPLLARWESIKQKEHLQSLEKLFKMTGLHRIKEKVCRVNAGGEGVA